MSNATNIVRIACDLARPNRAPVNEIDGQQVTINRGKAYCFEIGVYDKDAWQTVISQFASVNLQVRLTRTSTALIDVTALVPSLTVAESSWNNRTSQHVQIPLTGTQTGALAVPSPFTLAHWLCLSATTTGGEVVDLACGDMLAVETGSQFSGSQPIAGDPTYMTGAQTIAAIQSALGNREIRAGLWIVVPSVDSDGIVTFSARLA